MYVITDGAFYIESLGKDFGGKVVSGQESHGAPPGSHSLAIWATLWPASLFLLPGLAYAARILRSRSKSRIALSLRLTLCWVVPFWGLIEIMPTKLPHYGLPVFPALCLLMGVAILSMSRAKGFGKTRAAAGLIFIFITATIFTGIIFVQATYGDRETAIVSWVFCGAAGGLAIIAGAMLWVRKIQPALGATLLSSIIMMVGTYGYILPNLTAFKTSERLAAELERFAPNVESGAIHSPHFTEPSLVYHVGTHINLKAGPVDLSTGGLVILNRLREETQELTENLLQSSQNRGLCLQTSNTVKGFNYSKGNPVDMVILKEVPCAVPSP